jgi:class 3 adenylate cyclase/tetratricopeptide (TPR) repeat protein
VATCAACGYEAAASFRFCPECGAPTGARGREQRKVVTVLFCDVTGSTQLSESLDAEAVRALLARYFERMKAIVERHGGVVEKFIGDAVMAVFGLPAVHEDDALRALRAAVEMQQALPELGIEGRIGVCSGEVVTGTEERLATGDAVNVAARLQQAAQPGETLLAESTLRMAGDAVEAEPVEPLALKGKREPVPAWRLVAASVLAERRFDSPLVGREGELALLAEAWERACGGPGCELVTVVGAAGVGKTRLVAEFLAGVDATVVRGRCLSYGEGITYWPVVEVLKQLEATRSRLELDALVGDAIDALLGQAGTSSTDEIAWAFRKLLEAVTVEAPLVAVFDDIQWGEEVFLDLLEHVAFLSTGAPILLLCMARPELLDRRSGWSGVVRLQPLARDEAEALMESRLGDGEITADVRERILRAAGGNPLFVEEMAAMVQASGDGEMEVPPTLQALLTARLDQLDRPERSVLERGAVEGEIFHQGAVQALTPDAPRLTPQLTALVRKELIRPDRPTFAGDDAFRFRHLLMRDAAYESLPKSDRAALHEQFADWLATHGAELVELDELLGYHLEQAYRYRRELGQDDAYAQALAARGGDRLKKAGTRAVVRQDYGAGLALLERAAKLLPDELRDGRFEVDLNYARFCNGQGAEAVLSGLAEAADRAAAVGDRVTELALRVDRAAYELVFETTDAGANRLRELVDEALPVIEAADDHWALAVVYGPLVLTAEVQGRYADMAAAAERVVEHARLADDHQVMAWAQIQLVHAQYKGSTPVEECLRWLDDHPEVERRSPVPRRDLLLAMLGRFDEARRLLSEAADRAAELGAVRVRTTLAWHRFEVAMLEDDPVRAEEGAREACEGAKASGELGNYMSFCCSLAQALLAQGRADEAEEWLERGRRSDERQTQMLARQVQGKLLARRGEHDEGERLLREALAIAAETDMPNAHADALVDLAEVLTLAGPDLRAELEQALALYERKGNLVMAERTRSKLAELTVAP